MVINGCGWLSMVIECMVIDGLWIVLQFIYCLPQIIPNGEEIVPAVLAFAEELNKSPLKRPNLFKPINLLKGVMHISLVLIT